MARKAPPVTLTPDEQEYLHRWARRRSTQQGLALRARIVLACAEGAANTLIAARLGISIATVAKWRQRFLADRLEGLADSPRPGAPRRIGDGRVEEVVCRTLDTKPEDATQWSTRP